MKTPPFLLLIGMLMATHAWSQTGSVFNYKNKTISIPHFVENGNKRPDEKILSLLPSINQSPAEMEIRMYYALSWMGTRGINIIRFYKDSCVFVALVADKKRDLEVVSGKQLSDNNAFTLINTLNQESFFSLSDQSNTLESLKQKGVSIKDPCVGYHDCWLGDVLFEVKVFGRSKSFYLVDPRLYKFNPEINTFKPSNAISALLTSFY